MSLRHYNHLSPARQPGESFDNYRARRRVINKAIKLRLRGAPLAPTVDRHGRPRARVHPSKKLNAGMKRAERRALYQRNEWRAAS